MTSQNDYPFPDGVPPRRRRPRTASDALLAAMAGASIGTALGGGPMGAVLGAAIGAVAPSVLGTGTRRFPPRPLEQALDQTLKRRGMALARLYRHGPRRVRVLISYASNFWMVDSEVPPHPELTPEDIDDWLYGDIIDFQLPAAGLGGAQ